MNVQITHLLDLEEIPRQMSMEAKKVAIKLEILSESIKKWSENTKDKEKKYDVSQAISDLEGKKEKLEECVEFLDSYMNCMRNYVELKTQIEDTEKTIDELGPEALTIDKEAIRNMQDLAEEQGGREE